jgi:hypothetical protein
MLLLIMCRDLEVADRRMPTAIKLVLTQAFVAGSTALVRQLMGNRVLHRGPFAQRGSSPLCLHLGSQLLLEWLVLADAQASALPMRGCRALGAQGTHVTRRSRKLDRLAEEHGDALATRTGDLHPRTVQGEILLREQRTHLRPRAIMYTPCSAHWAIQGLAMYPRSIASCSRPGAFSNSSASRSTASCSGSLAGRTTTSRMTVLATSTATCSVKPLKVFTLLLRPWRMAVSSIAMRRSGATSFLALQEGKCDNTPQTISLL